VFGRLFIKPFLPLINEGFRSAAIVQAISQYLAEWPSKRGYKGQVVVIPNGASLPSAQEYPAAELEAVTREVGKRPDDVFMVTVARLVHQKAQDIVIRALPLLPENVRYLIVGEGPDRPMLEKLAAELGVSKRVTFTGQVDRTMTAKYRKISDVFVLPSRSEGQGISFLSTMVARLPMVATQEGGIAEFLFDAKRNPEHTTTGWAVDVDSPEQIADAVKDVLANPAHAKVVAENAYQFASKLYNWDTIAKDMRTKVFGAVFS
jgi:glycosyltransferase involved in cell wall biosynthesis